MEVNGVAALVTGGASGLGAAAVALLSAHGAKVEVLDLDEERGSKVAADAGGNFFRMDVTDEGSVIRALAAAENAHGPARVVVNCAGMPRTARPIRWRHSAVQSTSIWSAPSTFSARPQRG